MADHLFCRYANIDEVYRTHEFANSDLVLLLRSVNDSSVLLSGCGTGKKTSIMSYQHATVCLAVLQILLVERILQTGLIGRGHVDAVLPKRVGQRPGNVLVKMQPDRSCHPWPQASG